MEAKDSSKMGDTNSTTEPIKNDEVVTNNQSNTPSNIASLVRVTKEEKANSEIEKDKDGSNSDSLKSKIKRSRADEKRMPNIAMELAKNRTTVKSQSPSPLGGSLGVSSIPLSSLLSSDPAQNVTPENIAHLSKADTDFQRTTLSATSKLKVSSLLSDALAPELSNYEPGTETSKNAAPRVILPTQGLANTIKEQDMPGTVVARTKSPISIFGKGISVPDAISRSSSTLSSSTQPVPVIPAKRMQSAPVGEKKSPAKKQNTRKGSENGENSKKEISNSSETAKKPVARSNAKTKDARNTTKSTDSKKEWTTELKEPKKEVSKKETKKDGKKEIKATAAEKQPPKSSDKKKDVKTNENKKENKSGKKASVNSKKKDGTPQPGKKVGENKSPPFSPAKLVPAPTIKPPTILDALDQPKESTETEEPIIVVEVPLFSSEGNDYLDENGQVVLNLHKLIQDKFGKHSKAKRAMLPEINDNDDDDDDDDVAEVEDDDGVDEDDEEEDDDDDRIGVTKSPKKKTHPMKGKSLIGKYDTEDPFIDDSELLWEEQRVATKDGFFVYYGPLIEKGQYASFERVNGTMKRGGIKYTK
ncbi:LAMI_0G08944g1_1 [Lachancea mirantina]|uniref:LAMI_0G08944g1_1 n=1 Tax=Lachancea mirantina TaxID=1230905 RepID=A0A1G4KA64_9SACH|nr:LAMI_0G08944g1_1 [Lachancea mirantina]